MYINIAYKDAPELSTFQRNTSSDIDLAMEKVLLVNPNCPVRIMLEYIRKRCRLGTFTSFDLCDDSGVLMGLFNKPTYVYITENFVHKRTYYVIVLKLEADRHTSVLPQLNHENKFYEDLKSRIKYFLNTGEASPDNSIPSNSAKLVASKTTKRK